MTFVRYVLWPVVRFLMLPVSWAAGILGILAWCAASGLLAVAASGIIPDPGLNVALAIACGAVGAATFSLRRGIRR